MTNPSKHWPLHDTLNWCQTVLSHPQGVEAALASPSARALVPEGADVESLIEPSATLTSKERLEIYAGMYFMRLQEIMESDFPGVRHLLEEAFHGVARAYLVAHPSSSKSLNALGLHFPRYLGYEAPDLPHRDFAVELATLERTVEELFDDPVGPAPVTPTDVMGIREDVWASTRFRVAQSLRLFAFHYPVNRYLQAVYDDEAPGPPSPHPTHLAVYRHEWRVWRAPLEPAAFHILKGLAQGHMLGDAIEHVIELPGIDAETLLPKLGEYFQDWAASGFFTGVKISDDPEPPNGSNGAGPSTSDHV